VFCPLVFIILYASGVSLQNSLLSAGLVAVVGIVLILPFIFVFTRVDRGLWSPEEEIKRRLRFEQKMRELEGYDEDEDEEEGR
jgi:hypothetical protein